MSSLCFYLDEFMVTAFINVHTIGLIPLPIFFDIMDLDSLEVKKGIIIVASML